MFLAGAAAGLCNGNVSTCSVFLSGQGVRRKGCLRVYDANHSSLAVLSLGAIEPDGFGVVDGDGEDGHHRVDVFDGHETREEPGHIRHDVVDGDAGVFEGRLGDGVILVTFISFVSNCRAAGERKKRSSPWGRSGTGPRSPPLP